MTTRRWKVPIEVEIVVEAYFSPPEPEVGMFSGDVEDFELVSIQGVDLAHLRDERSALMDALLLEMDEETMLTYLPEEEDER